MKYKKGDILIYTGSNNSKFFIYLKHYKILETYDEKDVVVLVFDEDGHEHALDGSFLKENFLSLKNSRKLKLEKLNGFKEEKILD